MIGERIKELRKSKKMSQSELGKFIGVSQTTVTAWENGRAEPSSSYVAKLATFFNVSTDYLLGRDSKEDDLKTADKNVQLIAAHIDDGTTPEEMNDILTYIDFIKSKREKK